MSQTDEAAAAPRIPLSRDRVLAAAVMLADHEGLDAVSMRRLGQELGVEAMSLYNHVANKEAVLDGMAELVVAEIDLAPPQGDWKSGLRERMLAARDVMYRHPWAPDVLESRVTMTPSLFAYFDSIIGIMRGGGLSLDLIHHSLHALGSRLIGFTQELFDDSDNSEEMDEMDETIMREMADTYPNLVAMMMQISHDEDAILGTAGCDDQFEFVFTVDLLLDGIERLHLAEAVG